MMLAGGNIKRYYIRSKRIVLQKYETGQDQSSRVIYWKWAFSWAHLLAEIILYIFSSSVLIIAVNISSNAIKLLSFWRVFKSKKVVKSVSYFSHYHKDLALCVRSWKFFRMKIRETNIKKDSDGASVWPCLLWWKYDNNFWRPPSWRICTLKTTNSVLQISW